MVIARRISALAAAVALASIGIPTLAGQAGASTVPQPPRHVLGVQPSSPTLRPESRRAAAAMVAAAPATSDVRAAAVAPLAANSPACYGDSHSIAQVGGKFDPESYGMFYNCSKHELTVEVQTVDTWSPAALGIWAVTMNVDGESNGCFGSEYGAAVEPEVNNQGQFVAGKFVGVVGSFDTNCDFTPITTSAAFSITSNTVAISFPWSDIADSSTILWDGEIESLANVESDLVNGTDTGHYVPAETSTTDTPATGLASEAIPPSEPPDCTASATQVASTTNSARAAAILRNVNGVRAVHDYGEGFLSFTGDVAAAQQALADAGLPSKIGLSQTYHADSVEASASTSPPENYNSTSEWNLAAINAPAAWQVTTGNHVVVADIDTGVDFSHPALQSPQLVPGFDETLATPAPIDYSSGNVDTDGHGTAVAGLIASADNLGFGIASLGWNTSVMPVKVSTDGTFYSGPTAAGIKWAADNGAKVINLSFGGLCPDPTGIDAAVSYAQSKGVVVVAAAGNGALSSNLDPANGEDNHPSYPAADPKVLAVGATGHDGVRAYYSNTGSYVSLVAPGGSADGNSADDLQLLEAGVDTGNGGYTTGAGTSFASPQVAATAALILSVNPNLTASQVEELITGTATQEGPDGGSVEYGAGLLNAGAALADTPPTTAGFGTFMATPPTRLLDTRVGQGAPKAKIGPGGVISLPIPQAASGAVSAVVLNVTATNATASSYLTAWPAGQTRPNASSINFLAGQTVPNLVTVQVGSGGAVDLYNWTGSTDVVADLNGYYINGTQNSLESTFVPMSPTRLLDTRTAGGPVAGGTSRNLVVAGLHGVPADATAIVANVTVTGATAASYLTLYPQGQARPTASNMNFSSHETVANLAVVQLGQHGISIFNRQGSTHVIIDLEGYFTAPGDESGARYFPLVDHRILDTRFNIGGHYGPIAAGGRDVAAVTGNGGVLDGATSAVMNLTVTGGTASSYIEVYPSGAPQPLASNLNFPKGRSVANAATVALGTNGDATIYNLQGSVNVIADVAGWYGPPGA